MTDWNLTEKFSFEDRYVKYGILGNGPPVVVVHGTPWSSFNMRHIIQGLSSSFTVYYYDLIGYGQSNQSDGDVSLSVQNQILTQLLAYWELENPAVIGHDFGGATALRTHLINKQEFDKIILIDPVALSPWGSPFFQHVKAHEPAFAGVPDYIHEAIVKAYIKSAAHQQLADETLMSTIKPWMSGSGKAAFYRQIAQANEHFTDEVQPHYDEISSPVMILWGSEDSWIPAQRGRELQQKIPSSSFFEIPNSGHLVVEEQPELLLEKISDFLRSK